jgi:hypothetical protein
LKSISLKKILTHPNIPLHRSQSPKYPSLS